MKNKKVKNLRVVALLLACLVALTFTSCSAVFDSAISGTVKDRSARETSSTQSGGIADAMVYAYDDKSAWEKAYSNWDKESVFNDYTVPSAKTASDGSFSISSLRWKTNNPLYGKDADSRTVYLLVFHKDYGLTKVEGRTVQSDKSNNFGIVYCDKVSVSKNLVIKFKDIDDNSTTASGSDSTITDTSGFSFRYSYRDGYSEEGTDNVFATVSSITNGQSTITVKYKDGTTPPTVTVYDIQTGDDWTYEGSEKVEMSYSTSSKSYTSNSLYFSNDWETVTVTINLKDGATSDSVTDPIYFAWSYNNGDGDTVKSDTVTTTSGSTTINVKYKNSIPENGCVLTLSQFKDNNSDNKNYWAWTESETDGTERNSSSTITIVLNSSENKDKDTISQSVYFKKKILRLTSGLSGYAYGSSSTGDGLGTSADDGRKISLYKEETQIKQSVTTGQRVIATSQNNSIINHGYFTGLGKGEEFTLTYSDANSYKSEAITLTLTCTDPRTTSTYTLKPDTITLYNDSDLSEEYNLSVSTT